jgi:ADP-ribosylglycohydrolase
MPIPEDYAERVYSGVLGKIIGVYLGRPFEGWTYDRIMSELGEINYYVHEKRGTPLIVTDDDLSGTFTFLRALEDYGPTRDLSPQQIGQTWLNYIIEGRTILWWGGMGNSTEHTAYLRLKAGVPAPRSGAIATNGATVAEQIGAQIFIDGWGMVAPGDPELAADLARRAASVSHDGEAIHGAQVVTAMEAQAFVEPDLGALIDCAVSFIPRDSVIYRLISDLREWREQDPDWRNTRERIAASYGYDKYIGNCHIVPNHALVIHALLHGGDDFQRSLMIVNTSGWDTDCNSGNVGCILGIKNGLAGLDAGPDFRGPVADRLYLPTADGGRAVTDAVQQTYRVVNLGRALAGQGPVAPKDGARFSFELPGSVQGWLADSSAESAGTLTIENAAGHSRTGTRSLALRYRRIAPGRPARATTATFIPPEAKDMPGYGLYASPTLYSGQTLRARVEADAGNARPVDCTLLLHVYDARDEVRTLHGPTAQLLPGAEHVFEWRIPDTAGRPIARAGIELNAPSASDGTVYLDYLDWEGTPDVVLGRPECGGEMWRRAWVDGVDHVDRWGAEPYRVSQDSGTGLLIQGGREWTDYEVSAHLTPRMCRSAGLGARVQGMRRYYALLFAPGGIARLVKALDGETVLAQVPFPWQYDVSYDVALRAEGHRLQGFVNGELLLSADDTDRPLTGGAVALVCEEGRLESGPVTVRPAHAGI